MDKCLECRLDIHLSCRGSFEDCSCTHSKAIVSVTEDSAGNVEVSAELESGPLKERDYSDTEREAAKRYVESGSEGWSGKGKQDHKIKDPHSTGRKRAAVLYPLDRDAPCEWQNASVGNPMGGGPRPLTFGCDNLQSHRHHGPDKSTLNNSEGNVHRICAIHHNRWHSANNKILDMLSNADAPWIEGISTWEEKSDDH